MADEQRKRAEGTITPYPSDDEKSSAAPSNGGDGAAFCARTMSIHCHIERPTSSSAVGPKGTDNAKHRILDFFLHVGEADNSSAWQTNWGYEKA
jgi:hypothetical protein